MSAELLDSFATSTYHRCQGSPGKEQCECTPGRAGASCLVEAPSLFFLSKSYVNVALAFTPPEYWAQIELRFEEVEFLNLIGCIHFL
jgi:hypothetical protein